MTEVTAADATNVDEIELPDELPQPERSAVYSIATIGIEMPPARMQEAIKRRKPNARIWPMFHIGWKPLSFVYDFNPAVFTDNPDNLEHVWLTIYTDDGTLMGPSTQFGKLKEAFRAAGYQLTKNEIFKPLLTGTVWRTRTEVEDWARKDDKGNVTASGRNWLVLPVEQLTDYTPPPSPRVIRRGYGQGTGTTRTVEPTADQVAALKRVLNGKSEAEYVEAIMFGNEPLANSEPFITEMGDPPRLTERALKYGGQVVAGRIIFP